jgi:AcrR family transcriptional regulator
MSEAARARTAARHEVRVDAILDAASALLAEEGFAALTLAQVGKRAGYVAAALYRYFPSKDALVAALQRRTLDVLHVSLTVALDRFDRASATRRLTPEVRALARLRVALNAYLELPATRPHEFGLLSVLLGDPRQLVPGEEAAASAPKVRDLLADLVKLLLAAEAASAIAAGPALDRAIVLWATAHGLASLRKMERFDRATFDGERLACVAVGAMLAGFGAAPEIVARADRAVVTAASHADAERAALA